MGAFNIGGPPDIVEHQAPGIPALNALGRKPFVAQAGVIASFKGNAHGNDALLRQTPGAQLEVRLAPDGGSIVIAPARKGGRKPASVLFNRIVHRGKPVTIEAMDAALVAARQAQFEEHPDAA